MQWKMRVGPEGRLKGDPHARTRKNSDGLAPPRSSLSRAGAAPIVAGATQIVSQLVRE